jgi:hypothetical protein
VDVNPYAVAIARFRLIVAATWQSGLKRLAEAREAWPINVYCGDSLYLGARWQVATNRQTDARLPGAVGTKAGPGLEDTEEGNRVLSQKYHVVVGNPPYITVKDAALSQTYRKRYTTCHQKYSQAVPFTERFFDLCLASEKDGHGSGYVGMLTANSFMKREFGKKLIEGFLPRIELTHVIDTSGAYIPGHGTPTVILFGRNRKPVGEMVRAVLGIRGEPTTPDDPACGLVWQSIVANVDRVGTQTGAAQQ